MVLDILCHRDIFTWFMLLGLRTVSQLGACRKLTTLKENMHLAVWLYGLFFVLALQ
jgi:hypothetical protein